MRLADLQSFVDVVEAGGMTQAAAMKGVSQPGLSRTIRELEARMGTLLLRRTGRGVELTPAGSLFLEFARESLAALEAVERRIREVAGALPTRLRMAIPTRLGVVLFPDLYRRFLVEMPEVTLAVSEARSEEIAEAMAAGDLDIAVSYLPSMPGAGPGQPIYRERLHFVCRPDELGDADGAGDANGADGEPGTVPMAALAGRPILLTGRASRYRRLIEAGFARAGHRLHVAREIQTAEGLLAFTTEGEGETILPYSNFLAEAARGEVIGRAIVEPAIERRIHLHIARSMDPRAARAAARLVTQCLKAAADHVHWRPVYRS